MDIVIVLGLPRSGTTLVHNKIHEDTGRKAIYLRDLDLEVPSQFKEYHKNTYLAEIHDLKEDPRKYLETRGDAWVVKSVEVHQLPVYIDLFPEARYLITVRPAGELMASVQDYFQATGLRWPYSPEQSIRDLVRIAKAHPEIFSYIDVTSFPEWQSTRLPTKTFTSLNIDHKLEELKGYIERVEPEQLKERYRISRKRIPRRDK